MKIIKGITVFCVVLLLVFPIYASENRIVYCIPGKIDKTQEYILKLLFHSVKITNEEYGALTVVPYEHSADSIVRRLKQVASGKTDVIWTVTNSELEKKLVPVRIPLHKGVFGFRLLLINKKDQPEFDKIKSLNHLKKFSIGGGHDSQILKNAGLYVEKGSSYEGTFMMLARNRFDCLPKGISDVFAGLDQFGKQLPSLKLEDNLVLYYHQPVYFFFKDKRLAKRIEAGLEEMLIDGSFDKFFNEQYKDLLARANIAQRRILRIDAPLINTKSLPLDRRGLWYSVVEDSDLSNTVLNLSGKQRMLTQIMTKESFLIALDYSAEKNLKNLKSSSALFDKTLNGLRDGSIELNLPPTKNSYIVKELDKVKALWLPFYENIKVILSTKKADAKHIKSIADNNIKLLEQMDKCVRLYETESGKAGVAHDPFLAAAINLAGRQRMLSQKMTKEYLLIAYGYKIPENQLRLQQTYSLFDHTLKGLLEGDAVLHLKKAEKPHIRQQLLKVKALWQEFKPTLEEASRAGEPACKPETIEKISIVNLLLLKEMNLAVEMYEKE